MAKRKRLRKPLDPFDKSGHIRRWPDIELEVIDTALDRYDGNVSAASAALNVGRSTVYRRLNLWRKCRVSADRTATQ